MIRLLPLLVLLLLASPTRAGDGCYDIEVTWYSPTGIAGCTLDGPTIGKASWYGGEMAAANWCVWPWDDCGMVSVQSHLTGVTIVIEVGMFGDLYTGTSDERLIDLTREQVLALGLDPADGIFDVTVTPVREGASSATSLPDTAARR